MVNEENGRLVAKIIDFNIATRLYSDSGEKRTIFEKTGQMICRSPEMVEEGPYGYDERVDCWGAACCLYFMLTGHYPF